VGALRTTGATYYGWYVLSDNLSGDIGQSELLIYAKSGYIRTALTNLAYAIASTTITGTAVVGQVWNNTADNITSMTFRFNPAGSYLGQDTKIELYAYRPQ
jgi:hypothetical protein